MDRSPYDAVAASYLTTRRADPRIAERIAGALGDARSVVNVGAGTGSYEPAGRLVVAVEPSREMIRQRRSTQPAVRSVAESLPFPDGVFDAALGVLTIHHWDDWRVGVDEMRRVARRIVLLTFEPDEVGDYWLTRGYFPEILELDRGRCPPVRDVVGHLDGAEVHRVPVPHDCVDGFLMAFWRRPEAYLDPQIRAGMSAFTSLDPAIVERGIARLAADLASGAWDERYGSLRALDELDLCYRLLVWPGTR